MAQVCRHIAQSTLVFAREITRQDASLARLPLPAIYREHSGHLPTPDDQDGLIALLESTWAEAEQTLRNAGPDILGHEMRGLAGQPVLRLNALVFAECHEFYDAGQLTVYERSLDVVPALTRLFAQAGRDELKQLNFLDLNWDVVNRELERGRQQDADRRCVVRPPARQREPVRA